MAKIMRCCTILFFIFLTMVYTGHALGAVSAEEAAQLGKNLTLWGAEKAGNADGTIPEYTGGLSTPPAGFDPKSGIWPDPYADEKPLFTINAANMGQYADKLTEGTKALMKHFPDYRIVVYKTHRSVYYPQWILDNTVKLATTATTKDDGETLVNAHAGYSLPDPQER